MSPINRSKNNSKTIKITKEKDPSFATETLKSCKHCGKKCVKSGVEKNGKQRYKCTVCKKSQQADYTYNAYNPLMDKSIIALVKEGVGIRGASKLLGISATTLLTRIKKIKAKNNKNKFNR